MWRVGGLTPPLMGRQGMEGMGSRETARHPTALTHREVKGLLVQLTLRSQLIMLLKSPWKLKQWGRTVSWLLNIQDVGLGDAWVHPPPTKTKTKTKKPTQILLPTTPFIPQPETVIMALRPHWTGYVILLSQGLLRTKATETGVGNESPEKTVHRALFNP